MSLKVTERFSDRVADYIKYRPGYPPEVLELLQTKCALTPEKTIADIGSGTGIFSQLLLTLPNQVFAVEPNREMREAAEKLLGAHSNFKSINGTSEATTLASHSIDLITAAQAFHWFDPEKTRKEAQRILRLDGFAAFIWNERKQAGSPFLEAYENLLQTFGTDYKEVSRQDANLQQAMRTFFGSSKFQTAKFENHQDFDFAGLRGRALSSSYVPKEGHSNFQPMMERLANIFESHQKHGNVRMEYETGVYFGKIL